MVPVAAVTAGWQGRAPASLADASLAPASTDTRRVSLSLSLRLLALAPSRCLQALTKGDAKWEAAAARLADGVKTLKAYTAKAEAAKADAIKSNNQVAGADAMPEDPDMHGIGAFE